MWDERRVEEVEVVEAWLEEERKTRAREFTVAVYSSSSDLRSG